MKKEKSVVVAIPLKAGHRFRLWRADFREADLEGGCNPFKSRSPFQTRGKKILITVMGKCRNPFKSRSLIQTMRALIVIAKQLRQVAIPLKAGHRFRPTLALIKGLRILIKGRNPFKSRAPIQTKGKFSFQKKVLSAVAIPLKAGHRFRLYTVWH